MEYQFNKMCRICLNEGESMESIFYNDDFGSLGISVCNKIMACSTVQVVLGDGLPELICGKCLVDVNVAYAFREKCQSADSTLRKYLTLMVPYYHSQIDKPQMLPKEDEETIDSYMDQQSMSMKEETSDKLPSNIYEFDKEDSGTSLDENKASVDAQGSDSDAPLLHAALTSKEVHEKQKKKKEKGRSRTRKSKAISKCVEEDTSESEKKKEMKDEKDVQCPICNKTFAYMCILKDHMVQHTGAKPYLCSTCGKSFGHTASLTNHMKTHYSDKPHKCDHCELRFHRRAHLVLHLRTHTGEKPYVCEVCGRDFAQSSYLKEHMRVHSGEKPFVCDICGHGFARKSCLVMHRRVHTGELPYACPECGRAFSQRSQRKRHVKRNHKGSACLRASGELILKDLDVKNRAVGSEDLLADTMMATPLPNPHSHFRDCPSTLYPQDTTATLAPAMPLPLTLQIHRTLLQ